MKKLHWAISIALLLSMTSGAVAKNGPVLDKLPADTVGFFVVNDINATGLRLDAFLIDLGVGPMIGIMPGGPTSDISHVITMLKMQARLGEGFDPNGGFAAAIMDPAKFGMTFQRWYKPISTAMAQAIKK